MKFINIIKRVIPKKFKIFIKDYFFIKKYGFNPPPAFSDMSGYELLLDTILSKDFINLKEILWKQVFFQGGTCKLAKLLEKLKIDKKIYAIDIFDPEFDKTVCTSGVAMFNLYKGILKSKNQYKIYNEIIKDCKNIITLVEDSKKVSFPCEKISFAYIDGNHSSEYVENDFYLAWNKLVPRGIVAFDDYG